MNWDAIGAIAELLGSFAVFATLIYLAVQVRHSRDLLEENRKVALSEVYRDRVGFRIGHLYQRMNPMMLEIDVKLRGGTSDFNNEEYIANFQLLSPSEQLAAKYLETAVAHSMENSLYQVELGLLDELQQSTLFGALEEIAQRWDEIGIIIPPRIQRWREQNAGA